MAIKDPDYYVRRGAAESLGALAPIDPKLYRDLFEVAIKDPDYDVRWGAAESLGVFAKQIDFNKSRTLVDILKRQHGVDSGEIFFVAARLRNLVSSGEDLGKLVLEDIPAFRSLKAYAQRVNPDLPENKRSSDLLEFWQKNQARVAYLFGISRELTEQLIIQKINHFGFPRLERTLALADTLNTKKSAKIREVLGRTRKTSAAYLETLLELSDAYFRMGLEKKFNETIENLPPQTSPQEAIAEIGKGLLREFANKLGIKAKITDEALVEWNLEYLSKLFFAEKGFENESREVLKLIVKAALQGDFDAIIEGRPIEESGYGYNEIEMIEEIQNHNQKVREEFNQAGVDYQTWLRYPKRQKFSVGVSEKTQTEKIDSFRRELYEVAINLLGSYREKRPGILPQEKTKALFDTVFKKYGIKFREGEMVSPKGKMSPLDIQAPLQETIQFLEKEMQENPSEALGTNLDHLKNLLKMLPDLQKTAKQKGYDLEIKLWDRKPGYDIFQGNYTHCCIAIENFNRAAILDYLTDAGMNIIEVRDQNTGQTIAQTYVFLAQNESGENILVLDNVEINNDYRGLASKIKDNLFEYVAQFTDDIVPSPEKKINTVLLGTAYNDIDTRDLNMMTETIKKIGGAGTAGTQYLDSFGSAWVDPSYFTSRQLYVALDNMRERQAKKKGVEAERKSRVEILSTIDDATLAAIADVKRESFPAEMSSDKNDLRETLDNKKGVQIAIYSGGKIVGYISSKPQADALKELKSWDPEMRSEDAALYVESIAMKPEYRDVKTMLEAGKTLLEEATRKGYKKITMHARIAGGLSSILQKRYGARALHRIDNWHGFGEPFDYLEIDIQK